MINPSPKRPSLLLPKPLRAAELDTFTHHSVVVRLPEIGRRIMADNRFSAATNAALERLIDEIGSGVVRPLTDTDAPDTADWASYIAPFEGQNWLDIPWFFAETYFYRRVVEASGYFIPDHPHFGADPFAHEKEEGLEFGRHQIQGMIKGFDELFTVERAGPRDGLERLLAVALWGNQADLSLWPASQGEGPQHSDREGAATHILADDSAEVAAYLMAQKGRQVDVVLDNAGFELIADLCLTDFLLFSGTAETVRWHLKSHPTFVSDATIGDVRETVAWLLEEKQPASADIGHRLDAYLRRGRWQLVDHPFWTSPLPMWQMPDGLYEAFGRSDFIITKGDANYRRLLGDRHWPFTTPFGEIVSYAPAPLLALRTLKSEVAAGLTAEQVEALDKKDPEWLINGRWGLIQYEGKK